MCVQQQLSLCKCISQDRRREETQTQKLSLGTDPCVSPCPRRSDDPQVRKLVLTSDRRRRGEDAGGGSALSKQAKALGV